jgi:hypothetical protein
VKPIISILNNTYVGNKIEWLISASPISTISVGSGANTLTYNDAGETGLFLNNAIDNNAPGINSSFRYYKAKVTNGVCPAAISTPIELEVIPTPVIDSIRPNQRCGPGSVVLYAHSNLGVVNWFTANTGGSSIFTGENLTTPNLTSNINNFYASGLFRGCASLSRRSVQAEVIPIPKIIPPQDTTYCGPNVFNICASATDNGVINWYTSPTGGTPIQVGNCYTTPLLKTNTTYYLDAALKGCTTVTRTPYNTIIYEVPQIAVIPNLNLCVGNKVNLAPFVSLGLPPYTYSITYNNRNLLGSATGNINGLIGGIANVYFNIKDQHNCVSQNSNSFSIKTYDPVKPMNFNYSAFYKENYIIPTKKDSGYILYNWNPGVYLNFTNKPDPTFNGENSTDYVLLRTDTTSKCMVADNYHIDVTREYILDVPNAFTPNYDGLNDRLRIIANEGIESIESFIIINREGIQVFPKPGQVWSSTTAKDPMDIRGATGWNTWDGKDAQGRMLESDGYYWKAIYYIKPNHTKKFRTGMFILFK